MNSYRIRDIADDHRRHVFRKTRKEAHDTAKEIVKEISSDYRDDIRIELVEVPIDSASIHLYLNDDTPELTVLQRWKLTNRGGLVEVDAEGKPLEAA